MNIEFSEAKPRDLPVLADILNYYVAHSTVTFHKELLSAADMEEKVFFSKPYYQTFLVKLDGETVGYCAVSPWKKQEAYRNTAEINIYLRHDVTARGIGVTAVQYLEAYARRNDIHVLIAGLCSENIPSKKLFEKSGYELCAHFREVGHKFGRVLDVIYLQKRLS